MRRKLKISTTLKIHMGQVDWFFTFFSHPTRTQRQSTRIHKQAQVTRANSLIQRRLCLYRPQMKSPQRSHHVGWAWLQGWKLCPSPFSSMIWGSWELLRTLIMPTRLSRSGTLPGLILRALVLSRRGGEQGERVSSIRSPSDLRSWSSINSPQDIASLRAWLTPLSLTDRKTQPWHTVTYRGAFWLLKF